MSSSVEKQRELEAWFKQRAAEDNAKSLLALLTMLAKVDQTVYSKQFGKEIPAELFIKYFNAKTKIADAKRDIAYYRKLQRNCRPAELDGINRKIEQNEAYINAWQDRIDQGFKGWFETYGYPFLPELLPKVSFRKDRMTLGLGSKADVKALLDKVTEEGKTEGEVEEKPEEVEEEPLT